MYKGHFPGQAGRVDEMGVWNKARWACKTFGQWEERISFLIRSTYDVLPSP